MPGPASGDFEAPESTRNRRSRTAASHRERRRGDDIVVGTRIGVVNERLGGHGRRRRRQDHGHRPRHVHTIGSVTSRRARRIRCSLLTRPPGRRRATGADRPGHGRAGTRARTRSARTAVPTAAVSRVLDLADDGPRPVSGRRPARSACRHPVPAHLGQPPTLARGARNERRLAAPSCHGMIS